MLPIIHKQLENISFRIRTKTNNYTPTKINMNKKIVTKINTDKKSSVFSFATLQTDQTKQTRLGLNVTFS